MSKRKLEQTDAPSTYGPFVSLWPTRDGDVDMDMDIDVGTDRARSPARSAMSVDPPGSGRTRKRLRDCRPTQAEIHESTITKLFNAQRRLSPFPDLPMATPVSRHDSAISSSSTGETGFASDIAIDTTATAPSEPAQRTNLYSFWKTEPGQRGRSSTHPAKLDAVSVRPRSGPTRPTAGSSHGVFGCDICDRPIRPPPASVSAWLSADVGIEQLRDETACVICDRAVCALCSVVRADRRCLDCLDARL